MMSCQSLETRLTAVAWAGLAMLAASITLCSVFSRTPNPAGTGMARYPMTYDVALTAMAPRGFSYMAQNKLDTRVQTTLQALQQLARYLAGIPGRKNLVWFSGSFPINVFPDANAADSFQGVRQFGAEVQRTATLLTVAQVAIYPIAAEGLVSDSQFAATANRISESRALQTSPDFGDSGQRTPQ